MNQLCTRLMFLWCPDMKRNRILYFVLLFLTLFFIYFYGGKVPYTMFYLLLVLPVVSIGYAAIVFFRFKVHQELDKKYATKGDTVNFIVTASNDDFFLYPYIKLNFSGQNNIFQNQLETMSFSLKPFESKIFSTGLLLKYRGCYSIGIDSFEVEDFLGLINLKHKFRKLKQITVLPRIVRINKLGISTNLMSESSAKLNGTFKDITSMTDARKYVYGDPFKSIHWKLTAKMDSLMVKNMESTLMADAIFFLDVKKCSESQDENIIIEDKLIEVLVSCLNYCLSNWIHVNLVYFNNELVELEGRNPNDFKKIYNAISLLNFNNQVEMKDVLKLYLGRGIKRSSIFVFTSNLDYELFDEISKAVKSNFEVTIVYISPEKATGVPDKAAEDILSFLPELGINAYRININDNVFEFAER